MNLASSKEIVDHIKQMEKLAKVFNIDGYQDMSISDLAIAITVKINDLRDIEASIRMAYEDN